MFLCDKFCFFFSQKCQLTFVIVLKKFQLYKKYWFYKKTVVWPFLVTVVMPSELRKNKIQ